MNGPAQLALSRWESGSDAAPPPQIVALLDADERILWTAPVSSTVSADLLFRIGALGLVAVGILALLAPWGQSMDVFCPPGEPPSCRKGYFVIFLWIFGMGPGFIFLLWSAWKARYRPWLWHCVVTTTRALLIDGRGPKLAGAVDLARDPPMKDHSGRLAFGRKPIRLASFGALTPQDIKRAIFWATEGRSAETAKDARL